MVVANVSKALTSRAKDLGMMAAHTSAKHIAEAIIDILKSYKESVNNAPPLHTWREVTIALLHFYNKYLIH